MKCWGWAQSTECICWRTAEQPGVFCKAGLLGLRKPWFWIEIQCPETWAPENEPWGLQKAEVQASWVRRDWAKVGLCPGQTASAQAALATREEHLAERYGSAPGPSCTLIKQWKSIKDVASSDSQFAESQVKPALGWLRARSKVGCRPSQAPA